MISCSSNNHVKKYYITKYLKVGNGYEYSHDIIKYHLNKYKPTISLAYSNDTLITAEIFKSDGSLVYTKDDLEKDSLLVKMLSIEMIRKIQLKNNNIIYKKKYLSSELIDNKIYCLSKDSLFVYRIEK